MTGVVLRCRTCGTTQERQGECDVCSSGPVTYFCGNHSPGMWLDGPECPACGSRVGDAPRKPAARPSSGAPSIPRSRTRPSPSAGPMPGEPRPASPGVRRMPRPTKPPPPGTVAAPDDDTGSPSLADLLVTMAEEGRRTRETAVDTPRDRPRGPGLGIPIVGCLFRLAMLLLFLGVLAVAAVALLFSGGF